ncbi:hypothetical protein M426DRAFT_22104 [Hypoxylon sp. CI-4A]|nr:hypothetical protein M426DRAFT_22104 [Hypoxylon sp. CI-4A]
MAYRYTIQNRDFRNWVSLIPIQPEDTSSMTDSSDSSDSCDESVCYEGFQVNWPAKKIPVQLFLEIAKHASHEDLKAMRLVNTEFYVKTTLSFLGRVVITLHQDLEEKLNAVPGESPPADLTRHLMESYIFRHSGKKILRLGLALELDKKELASPSVDLIDGCLMRPEDCLSKALGRLTQTLEESQTVLRVLSATTGLRELALSCQGGLGYLRGVDVNEVVPQGPPAIFDDVAAIGEPFQVTFTKSFAQEVVERQLQKARTESGGHPSALLELPKKLFREGRRRPPLPATRYAEDVFRPQVFDARYRLQPDQLTVAQVRYIFQHVAAERAFIQSFVLAGVDRGHTFSRLTKVNIARIPSLHIEELCRDDFWASFPKLDEVSIGIVPDWREVTGPNMYRLEVGQVYPTDAMPKAYKLLSCIGKLPNVKRLHFEWHCGGELAVGVLHRNTHILPAPFLAKHRLVLDSRMQNLLILPHVTHLSLKNCWFAPNVFYRIMDTMSRQHALKSLELETVSLSGPPRHVGIGGGIEGMEEELNTTGDSFFKAVEFKDVDGDVFTMKRPLALSWPHIIDMLQPGWTLAEAETEKDKSLPLLRVAKKLKLRCISCKSCGYVEIPDNRFISSRPSPPRYIINEVSDSVSRRRITHQSLQQVSTDRHLGAIIGRLDAEEANLLHSLGFSVGQLDEELWPTVKSIEASFRDGFEPGAGRFSGQIQYEPMRYCGPQGNADENRRPIVDADYVYSTEKYDRDYVDQAGLETILLDLETRQGYYLPQFGTHLRFRLTRAANAANIDPETETA